MRITNLVGVRNEVRRSRLELRLRLGSIFFGLNIFHEYKLYIFYFIDDYNIKFYNVARCYLEFNGLVRRITELSQLGQHTTAVFNSVVGG